MEFCCAFTKIQELGFFLKVDFRFRSLVKLIKWVRICSSVWGAESVLLCHVCVQVNLVLFPPLPCKVVGKLILTIFALQLPLVIQGNRVLYLSENLRKGLAVEVAPWKGCRLGATVYMSSWATGSLIPSGPEGPGLWPRFHVGSPTWHRAPKSSGVESCLLEIFELFPS